MAQALFTVEYSADRSRIKNLFRVILVIPHMIIVQAWQQLVQVVTLFQWFIILFTGQRNQAIWKLQNDWLAYASRVWSYYSVMYDKWPNIGAEPNGEPTSYSFEYSEQANRLTNFFRILWLIPSFIIGLFVIVGAAVCTVLAWFAIVITGRHPRGLFDFVMKSHQFVIRVQSCALLMTDTRPKFGA
jgi:hypothetical protein